MNGQNQNIKEIIISDLKTKAYELLVKHLDGRNYNETKVEIWIEAILIDFENYFKEKYPNYYLFQFCAVCSINSSFYNNSSNISKALTGHFLFSKLVIFILVYIFSFLKISIQINVFH